jgi:hypothetical protein
MNIGGGEPPAPMNRGPLSAAEAGCAITLGCFLAMVLLWPVWVCLYPLAAGAGTAVGFAVASIFKKIILPLDPTAGDVANVIGLAAAIAVGYKLGRMEHRLARNAAYAVTRHLVRLVLLAILIMRAIHDPFPLPRPGERLINFDALSNPSYLANRDRCDGRGSLSIKEGRPPAPAGGTGTWGSSGCVVDV